VKLASRPAASKARKALSGSNIHFIRKSLSNADSQFIWFASRPHDRYPPYYTLSLLTRMLSCTGGFVLFAALLHASWNAMLHGNDERFLSMT